MKEDSVSNAMDGPEIDEEKNYRTILVKSLSPSISKQNLIIHFQSRKNGGGDIEEITLLDHGSAIITFKEEKVAKSVQKKEQRFDGVLLTVEQYKGKQEQMENLQVFSKVSAMIDPKKLGLTTQETQNLLKEIQDETKVDFAKPQNKRDVFVLIGTFQQIQKSHWLLQIFLSKDSVCNGTCSSRKEDVTMLKDLPKGMQDGKEWHMNGTEELFSLKDEAKSAAKKVNGTAKSILNQPPKTSKESSTSEKERFSNIPGLKTSKKEKPENHVEILQSKPSDKNPSLSDTRMFDEVQGSFKHSTPNKGDDGPRGMNGEKYRDKNKSTPKKKESNSNSEEKKAGDTHMLEISCKVWYVFVKIYENELQSVMSNFSVHIEPEDNHSVAIIKPSGECTEEKLEMAEKELKKLYEEGRSKMKSVRFVLTDPENREHDSIFRKTVLQVKKAFPVFLERAEDRQSWDICGEAGHVEKGMKVLEENVKLERKEQHVDDKTLWEKAGSEEESDDADEQSSDDSAEDDDNDDDDIWKYEKLEHQLGKVKVSVYRGDITEDQCDAIVNAANERLEHGAGVAWAIASKGGHSIQDECRRIVNTKGILKVGDVAVSPSGRLKCKMVIHAVGPNWKSEKGEKGKELLKKACKESLMQAEKYSFKSIAFPAVSSGIFGMPKHLCAQVMFDVAEEYSKSVTSSGVSGVRDIRFVNNDAKTVRAFRSEFKTRYGSGKVISENKDMGSGNHAAIPVENPSMRGENKSSLTWKVESNKNVVRTKTNKTEFTKHSERMPSNESRPRSQENGLSLLSRGGGPKEDFYYQLLADNMEKLNARPQNETLGRRPAKEDSGQSLSHNGGNTRQQNKPRGDKETRGKFMDAKPKDHSHSGKHSILESHPFSGGARPKQGRPYSQKDKKHTEHLLPSSSSTAKDDGNKCSICLDKMKQPETLPKCKHTFCKRCLETALQQSPNRCPYCREPLTDKQSSATIGQGRNDYREDEFSYFGLDCYDDSDDNATLCLICAKPARHAKTLPCRHTFCRPCFDRALKEYSACPCCSELERNQPSSHTWNQDPYDQQFSYSQDMMDIDPLPQGSTPDFHRERLRSNRGNRLPYAHDFDGYEDHGNGTRRGQPGISNQLEGTMRDRREMFSLPGYEGCETIVIQYSFRSGQQGPGHPNPGFNYDGTSRSAYLPDCSEGRIVLKLLRKAFDAGLIFRIGRSMTSKLDNQIVWADIPHKTNTSGGPTNYGYPDPTYLSDIKQQLQAALNGRR